MSLPTISGIPMPNPNAGLTVAGSFLKAFNDSSQLALEKERQASDLQMRDKQMERQDQLMAWEGEDRAYAQSQRPIQEKMAQMSLTAQGLSIATQSQNLQLGQMRIGDQLQRKQMLSSILGDMQSYSGEQASGAVPVTSYSQGAAVGGPDEMQDSWTNKGYSASGKNLTKGIVAVNPQKYPLGTVFRDDDTGEVFIAGDKHGNKNPDVVDIYMPPEEYKQTSGNRNLKVVGNIGKVPDTPEGVQKTLALFKDAGDIPVYAQAASSTNPTAVISQAFSPQQQKFLSHYDNLQLLAQEGQGTADGMQAMMMMRQMERNPEFQAALGQREVLLETSRNQAALNRTLLGARQDQVLDFTQSHPQFKVKVLPDGQMLPMNAFTGKPLNLQEQAAFGQALQSHAANYKPGQARKIDASIFRQWGDALQTIKVASSMTAPASQGVDKTGKPYPVDSEQMAKYQEMQGKAEGARMQMLTLASQYPELANLYQVLFPPQPKPDPTAAAAPGAGGQAPAPAKRITTSAERKEAADNAGNVAKWTEAKQSFGKAIELDYPDSGAEDPESNAALALAMDIYANSGPKRGDYRGPEGRNKALKVAGWDGYETAFDDTSRWGLDAVKRHEVVTAWAEDTLRKHGYLGQQGAAQPQPQQDLPKVATDADFDALPTGTQFIDPHGVVRVKP